MELQYPLIVYVGCIFVVVKYLVNAAQFNSDQFPVISFLVGGLEHILGIVVPTD